MKRRWLLLLGMGLLILPGLIIRSQFRPPPDPEFAGKPLSYWLDQIQGPSNVAAWDPRLSLTPEAAEAVRQIGSNAIPVLLRKMSLSDSSLQSKLAGRLNDTPGLRHLPPRIRGFLGRLLLPADYNPGQSIRGFRALGPLASSEVPRLIGMLGDLRTQESGFFALCAIGPEAIDEIANSWSDIEDSTSRRNIFVKIEYLYGLGGRNIPDFTPVLLRCVREDPDGPNRAQAARLLGTVARSPDEVVPALIELLETPDRSGLVRLMVPEALGKFGTNASPAVPALKALLTDENPNVRANASSALMRIDSDFVHSDGGKPR